MKKLMSILGGLLVATAAQAVDAYLDLASLNCNPATNRIVEHQRLQPFPGNTVSNWSGAGGFVVISNVGVGDYNVWVKQRGQAGPIAFSFSITTNDSGTVFVHTNNLSVVNVGTYPKTGQAAWSIAASESRYAPKGAGVAVAAGDNVTATTNGTVVTISADPGGVSVTGGQLAVPSTNAGVVTVTVSTNAVSELATNVTRFASRTLGDNLINNGNGTISAYNRWQFDNILNGEQLNSWWINANGDAGFQYLTGKLAGASSVPSAVTNQWQADAQTAALNATNKFKADLAAGTVPVAASAVTGVGNGSGLTNIQSAEKLHPRETNSPVDAAWQAKLFPVPPRMWRTWPDHTTYPAAETLTETYVIAQADWFNTNGMKRAGFNILVAEEGWQGPALNPDGTFTVTNRFPSGMAYLAAEISKRGFMPGIYTGLGPNSGVTSCMGFQGTCYTNLVKHVQQFSDWGFKFCYFDACTGWYPWTEFPTGYSPAPTADYNALYTERCNLVHEAVRRTGKPMATYVVPPGITTVPSNPENVPLRVNPAATSRQCFFSVGWLDEDFGLAWDFVPTSDVMVLSRFFIANWDKWVHQNQPGTWAYPLTLNFSLSGAGLYHASALMMMVPTAINTTSSFMRRDTNNPPSTWYGDAPLRPLTNLLAAAIHQDPYVRPGRVVETNATSAMFIREIGPVPIRTNALLLANWDTSPKTWTVNNSLFGRMATEQMEYTSIFFLTNVATSVNGEAQITVGASNSLWVIACPHKMREAEFTLLPASGMIAGTLGGFYSLAAQSHAPWNARAGFWQANASSLLTWEIALPAWANRYEFELNATTLSTNVMWTNTHQVDFYGANYRIQWSSANTATITNIPVLTTNLFTALIRGGAALPYTNAVGSRSLLLGFGASTNTSARAFIGPLTLRVSEE